MNTFEIIAEKREGQGKGASRRLRHAGKVPAIVYGAGQEPVNVQLEHRALAHQSENEAFYSHILNLKIGDASERVVVKAMQRHPFKPLIMHVDLLRVAENEELQIRVPLHFINEDKCVGVRVGGGQISHVITELEIVCLPKDLPEYIEVDIADMEVGSILHVADLKLPNGVEAAIVHHGGDASVPVVTVHAPRVSAGEGEGDGAAAS